jgi:predicted Rossmann fold nucleotide-binding protein DprA/Smf involved in DNA uptake
VLFGCGNRNLLNQGGVAVVGSRNAADQEVAFATKLGNDAALQGLSTVSGGARGVDEAAMLGALDREGMVVGVLADGLLRAATSARYRNHLMANNLVLVSPFNPEAGFDVGHAMARNRYIYSLSDAAIVVSSGRDKGGTWNGAIENLKEGWVPLWVKLHPDVDSGNAELVRRGARWLPDDGLGLAALVAGMDGPRLSERTARGLSDAPSIVPQARRDPAGVAAPYAAQETTAPALPKALPMQATSESSPAPREEALFSFYDLFLCRLQDLTSKVPLTAEQLLRARFEPQAARANRRMRSKMEAA